MNRSSNLKTSLTCFLILLAFITQAAPIIYINQVAFDVRGAKTAVIRNDIKLSGLSFKLINSSGKSVFTGTLKGPEQINDWVKNVFFIRQIFRPLN